MTRPLTLTDRSGDRAEDYRRALTAEAKTKFDDIIKAALNKAISNATNESLGLYMLRSHVHVRKAADASPVTAQRGRQIGWSSYHLGCWWDQAEVPRHVCYNRTSRRVKIRCKGKKVPISQIMQSWIPDDTVWKSEMTAERGWQNQISWWGENGKHFPLLLLPLELRQFIYQAYIVADVPFEDTIMWHRDVLHYKEALQEAVPILALNKQVHHEVKALLAREYPVRVEDMNNWMKIPGRQTLGSALTNLHLALTPLQHLTFFGGQKGACTTALWWFRGLQFRKLTLEIVDPNVCGYGYTTKCTSPSSSYTRVNLTADFERQVEEVICQAWIWVRGQPVTLCGIGSQEIHDSFNLESRHERREYLAWLAIKQQSRETDGKARRLESGFVQYYQQLDLVRVEHSRWRRLPSRLWRAYTAGMQCECIPFETN